MSKLHETKFKAGFGVLVYQLVIGCEDSKAYAKRYREWQRSMRNEDIPDVFWTTVESALTLKVGRLLAEIALSREGSVPTEAQMKLYFGVLVDICVRDGDFIGPVWEQVNKELPADLKYFVETFRESAEQYDTTYRALMKWAAKEIGHEEVMDNLLSTLEYFTTRLGDGPALAEQAIKESEQ